MSRNSENNCSYTNGFLYTEIEPTHALRLQNVPADTATLYEGSMKELQFTDISGTKISDVCAGSRDNTACVLMEW